MKEIWLREKEMGFLVLFYFDDVMQKEMELIT